MRPPLLVTDASGRLQAGTRRPWTWLLALLSTLLVADLLITLVRPAHVEPVLADDAASARAAIDRATEHEEGWLLLGDSVLAGDVMQTTVPKWSEHRVLDYLRRETNVAESVGFEQIALDGMLPVDMLHLLERLDAVDPGGNVGVVLEINPRFFSPHHAQSRECTRPFLCELGATESDDLRWSWAEALWRQGQQWALDHLPIVRHRELFPRLDASWSEDLMTPAKADKDTPGELMGRARILEHYRGLRVDRRSIQFRALDHIVRRLRARKRPALLFATPLNDEIMRGTLDEGTYGSYIASLDRLVNTAEASSVRFLSLDHPALGDVHFLDHAHLGPQGNRWLALNLLHQLGVGMTEPPPRGQLAYEEGVDRSLVARIARGNSEGAPWQALLRVPEGIAVSPGGGRVVIADTGNHCVRELVGPKSTVRTLAGVPGKRGHRDGRARAARLTSPRFPALLGDDVYVVEGSNQDRLRVISGGKVRELKPEGRARFTRIDKMRSDGRYLWLLDHGRRLLRFDPKTDRFELRHRFTSPLVVAFDIGPDGRIYFGDEEGRVWQRSPGSMESVLLFANEAEELLPQGQADYFPFDFDEMALAKIVDLRYIPRYDAVLVQDDHEPKKLANRVTERIHLRLLSFAERKIYPWVHPLAFGGGQMFHNRHSGGLSSYMHLGSMDIDPQSGSLMYVELQRSRVLQLSDGLLGAAKLGHHITPVAHGGLKDVFGREAGTSAMLDQHPERWARTRLEPIPRKGPFIGVMLGSSMTSMTQTLGQYSMARIVERELSRQLGLADGIRFDLVQRAYRGPRLSTLVNGLEAFVGHQSPVDVIFIEAHSGRMYREYKEPGEMAAHVDRLRLAAARYRSLVVVLDNDAMTSRKRDGLRGNTAKHLEFLELCEQVGFVVVRPGDMLLREAIDHAPWGDAPFSGSHGSVWSIDLTARAFAQAAYPAVRDHLRGKLPALARPVASGYARTDPLRAAFTRAGEAWADFAADVSPEAMQLQLDARHLRVLIDAGQAKIAAGQDDAALEKLALGYLVEAVVRDSRGSLANRVTLSIVRFGSYDEYGVGVLEGATIEWSGSWSTEELEAYLKSLAK